MMRKRRLSRLNIAMWSPPSQIQIDWDAIGKACNLSFTAPQRQTIESHVVDYLLFEGAERAAPFQRDRDAWLKKLGKIAQDLQTILTDKPCSDRSARYGLADVQVKFDMIAKAAWGHTVPLDYMAAFLASAVDAVERQDLSHEQPAGFEEFGIKEGTRKVPPGFQEGLRWVALVSKLRDSFTQWQLPAGIRNDAPDDKSNSEFVKFFSSLQRQFPAEAQRHNTQGLVALAKAMTRAVGTPTSASG
ncbi:MAG: hypothetical protein ACYC5H_19120 [Methylovirgula sp.]